MLYKTTKREGKTAVLKIFAGTSNGKRKKKKKKEKKRF